MLEYKYDTQLLIEGTDLNEDAINKYFTENFDGDCQTSPGRCSNIAPGWEKFTI